MAWAKNHDKCIKCGTTELSHRGRGLCKVCYGADNELRHKVHISRKTHRLGDGPLSLTDLRRQSPYLALPSPYTRSSLSQLLEISSRQVGRIMRSAEIMGRIQKLSRIADITGEAFGYSLQELNSQVYKLLGISKTSDGITSGRISIDDLRYKYVDEQMSLSDLARHFNCTRQYIHKLLKQHDIERRDMSAARILAINKGKLSFTRIDDSGNESQVILQKIIYDKSCFRWWSPGMAYALGVIYTDGNIIPGRERDNNYKSPGSRLSIAQKDPELLEKVLALMSCNAKLYLGKQAVTGNPINQFNIRSEELYDDLLMLGVTPKKSRVLCFPQIPEPYIRHFIRGCWDGDGSVYFERGDKPRASYVTGSQEFAEAMKHQLVKYGLPVVTLHRSQSGTSFYFRFGTAASCSELYHVLYDGVSSNMYLSRKFDRFKAIAFKYEGGLVDTVKYPLEEPVRRVRPFSGQDLDLDEYIEDPNSLLVRQLDPSKTLARQPKNRSAQSAFHLAIPQPFSRSTLSALLGIAPSQVGRIMQSADIVEQIKALLPPPRSSNDAFTDALRKLKIHVYKFLHAKSGEA